MNFGQLHHEGHPPIQLESTAEINDARREILIETLQGRVERLKEQGVFLIPRNPDRLGASLEGGEEGDCAE